MNVQFEATNGPLTGWKFDGTIPDGLKFDPSTGVLSGSTSAVGTYTIQVYAQNKNGWSAGTIYSFKIKDSTVPTEPLTLNGSSFEVTSGEAFTKSVLTVSGGEDPYFFEYTADAGKLDLNINASTGEFTSNGITVENETVYELTVKVTDGKGDAADTKLTLTVKPAAATTSVENDQTEKPVQENPAQETPAQETVTLEDNAFVEPVVVEKPAAEPVAENVTVALAKPEHVKLVLKKDGSWMLKWDAVENAAGYRLVKANTDNKPSELEKPQYDFSKEPKAGVRYEIWAVAADGSEGEHVVFEVTEKLLNDLLAAQEAEVQSATNE